MAEQDFTPETTFQTVADLQLPQLDISQEVQGGYSTLMGKFNDQLKAIEENPDFQVDFGEAIGEYEGRMEDVRGRITESALASVSKAAMEADAYLGSVGSDQRSAARSRMASNVKREMMQTTFQTIAGIYKSEADTILSAKVSQETTQLQAATSKSQAIAQLLGQSAGLYSAQLNAESQMYTARLSAAVQMAGLLQRDEIADKELKYKYDAENLKAALSVYNRSPAGFEGSLAMGSKVQVGPEGVNTGSQTRATRWASTTGQRTTGMQTPDQARQARLGWESTVRI